MRDEFEVGVHLVSKLFRVGGELRRTPLPGTWVNRRYDARSVDDPGYTDTVREDFDRIADLSEAEGWDLRVVMGPRRPGCR
jgi:hypothetical protein